MSAAAQRGVFQYMGHSGGIHGNGAQGDQKDILRVFCSNVEVLRARFTMPVFLHGDIQRFDRFAALPGKCRVLFFGGRALLLKCFS